MPVVQQAVEGWLADDGVYLAQRELRPSFEPAADEVVSLDDDAALQGRGAAVVGDRGAVLSRQRQNALNAADRHHAGFLVHPPAEPAYVRPGGAL